MGDLSILDDASQTQYCQCKLLLLTFIACRALFPGCKRCETVTVTTGDTGGTQKTFYRCASCEEGLYLYPYDSGTTIASQGANVPFPMNVCISDCPSFDATTVNNPEEGTCSYLGVLCKYGNYTHGCLEPLLSNDGSKIIIIIY